MTTPDRTPGRKQTPLDPDLAPIPPAAWVLETVNKARRQGLHPTYQDGIAWLLGITELRDAPLPAIYPDSRGVVVLLWKRAPRLLRVELHWTGKAWTTHLMLYLRDELTADERHRCPGDLMRRLLARVYPTGEQ